MYIKRFGVTSIFTFGKKQLTPAKLFPYIFLALVPCIFYSGILFGETFISGDSFVQDFPLRYYLGMSLENWHIPLWASEANFGFPFLAEISTGSLYPVNWFFSKIAYHYGFKLWQYDILFHLSISSIFYYIFLQSLEFSTLANILLSITFSLNGYFQVHSGHNSYLHSLSYTGLMLWYLQRFSKGEILKSLLGLFISLSISFLAGSPPVVFLQCIIVFTYFTIYFLSKFFTTHESSAIKNGFSIAYIFYFSLSLILLLLVLVQFKETHTLSLLAARRYWPEEFYFGFSSKVRSFMHLFYGNWFEYFPDFGNEEFFAYSGILISLLAIIGLTTAKFKRLEITFLFLGILGFVFAHATNPIYKYAFYHFPFFSEFRAPGRFIFLSLISLLYFAGLGIQTIQNGQLKSSKYLIVSIIFFSITYFIIPFYKNTNSMPFNQIGFSKFYIDALFFLLSISLISISLKYSQVIFLSIILLPLDLYYHAKNTMPMKELPKIKVSSSNLRYIPKNLNESLHDNFSLLGKGNSMVGYLTLEQYSVYKFKEMFFSLPDKKRLTFARAGALEFAVNNCDFAWNTNNFQFINKENLLLSLANYSEDTCPVFMDTIDTFSDFPNSKIFYQSVITEHVNFEKYRFSIKNSKIQKGILYVSIAHHPNWKAFMKNNLSLKIIKANYAFMAIVIPEELDEVLLEYKLFSF